MYVDLDCGPLCESIEGVTEGYQGAQLSHVGILTRLTAGSQSLENQGWSIVEARGSHVRATPIDVFFKTSPKDKNNKEKIIVGRINQEFYYLIPDAIKYSKNQIGKPYDSIFKLGEDQFYCSELIYYAFKKDFFKLNTMTFKYHNSPDYLPQWIEYYKELKSPIPEGYPGINPGAMSKQKIQNIVHLYGIPDGYISRN